MTKDFNKLINLRNKATQYAAEADNLVEQQNDIIKAAYDRGRRDAFVAMTNIINEAINE